MAIIGPFDFRGGYCSGYEFISLPQNTGYANIMENCRFKDGYVNFRWGQRKLNAATNFTGNTQIDSLAVWTDTVNAKLVCVTTNASKLLTSDITGIVPGAINFLFNDRTGALAASSLSGTTNTYDSLNNILVGGANSASSGVPFKVTAYNTNGAALGGSPPSADIAKQVNNFMFLSRNLSTTTTQSRVYWSNVNDPETWNAANVLDFNKNDGEPIMALGSIGTDLYIFKQNSIGRLSTVTLTVSGAVTLGPLTTVIRGVGCCGPRAIDNLPNGNIVFVSFDGKFYEFDGSTLLDHSREPFPGKDCYNSGQFLTSNFGNFGISNGVADVTTCVKVTRGINEVWISYTASYYAAGPLAFTYDFENRLWQGVSLTLGVSPVMRASCMSAISIVPSASINNVESREFLIHGNLVQTNPGIVAHGDSSRPYATDDSGSAGSGAGLPVAAAIGTTIELQSIDGKPFIPRSLYFETAQTTNGSGGTGTLASFTAFYSFDKYIGTDTNAYTAVPATVLPTRIIVPLTFKQDAVGTNIFPSNISVLFQFTGTGSSVNGINYDIFRLGKFWLSDEAIR